MAFKQKPLNQEEYSMTIIEDLGITFNEEGTRKSRYAIVECTKCNKHFKLRMGSTRAKQQLNCIECEAVHNLSRDPLYAIWNGIIQRCYSPARKDYGRYGGLGVTVCESWRNGPTEFINWCKANGWTEGKTIDKDIKSKELGIYPPIYSPETVLIITSQENIEAALSKKVNQYSLEGEFIQTHVSCTKAALSFGKPKVAKSSIANCARGVSKTAFGFLWKFTDDTGPTTE